MCSPLEVLKEPTTLVERIAEYLYLQDRTTGLHVSWSMALQTVKASYLEKAENLLTDAGFGLLERMDVTDILEREEAAAEKKIRQFKPELIVKPQEELDRLLKWKEARLARVRKYLKLFG